MPLQQARLALTTSVGRGWGGVEGWVVHWYHGEAIVFFFKKKKNREDGISVFLPEYQLASLTPSVPMTRKNMGKWWQGRVRMTFSEALGTE